MTRLDIRTRSIAAILSGLAGFVDAVGFLGSGGFFVSFMSGNSTRLGIGLATAPRFAAVAGLLILSFIAGVVLASLTQRAVPKARSAVTILLAAITLAAAAALHHVAPTLAVLALVAMAMGAENVAFTIDGDVIGLTYMTGTLVKIGRYAAVAIAGGDRWAWLPFALLWMSLIVGGVLGAISYVLLNLDALWVAAGLTMLMAISLWRFPPVIA
jgi:uncharacterized membrane protein YoaK (UPF0700 family)